MTSSRSTKQVSIGETKLGAVGLGAMGMAAYYGRSAEQSVVNALLDECISQGYTMIDTADAYSPMSFGKLGFGELQIGQYLKARPDARNKLFIASKFGFTFTPEGLVLRGDHDYVHSACNASLERLGVKQIDLYYAHRPNLNCTIKETVEAMKELKEQGKIRYVGVSEYTVDQLEEANRIVKIDAVQIELSPTTPQVLHNGILAWCEKNGAALVAYRPLGIGFLSGSLTSCERLESDDVRRMHPRFSEENVSKNLQFVRLINEIASKKLLSTCQLSLAWVLAKSPCIVAIPGTKRLENLRENFSAETVQLSEADVARMDKIIASFEIGGAREGDVPWKGTAF